MDYKYLIYITIYIEDINNIVIFFSKTMLPRALYGYSN